VSIALLHWLKAQDLAEDFPGCWIDLRVDKQAGDALAAHRIDDLRGHQLCRGDADGDQLECGAEGAREADGGVAAAKEEAVWATAPQLLTAGG